MDIMEQLDKIKSIFNTKYKEQFISKNGVILYATTEDEFEESKILTTTMDKVIRLFELLPELIDDVEYLLDMEEESCADTISLKNRELISNNLQKVKEIIE